MTATQKPSLFQIYFLSESAVTIQFGDEIAEEFFKNITAFNQLLQKKPFVGFKTSVAAYTTLTVYYEPLTVYQSSLKGTDCFEKVGNYLNELHKTTSIAQSIKQDRIVIPVYYGGKFGPDLSEIAQHNQLTENEVIQLHSNGVYTVYMIGFVPGFAYMGGMDEKLATPRKPVLRNEVPAGAVGIAGNQTGIYPLKIPGGWQILGQTPVQLFDINRLQPSFLKAGDKVVFKPIDITEFEHLTHLNHDQDR